jgi:hypothetical protein
MRARITTKNSIKVRLSVNLFSMCMHVAHPKTIMEHCQGQDYKNPGNLICAQSLMRFKEVSKATILGLVWMHMYSSQSICVEVDWSGIKLNSF